LCKGGLASLCVWYTNGILCQIEQWTEHHYPSFLQITGSAGSASTAIDPSSTDSRVALFTSLAKAAADATALKRREEFMADLRARGIIKDRTPEEIAAGEKRMAEYVSEETPWLMIIGMIAGVLALMIALGGGMVWLIVKYTD
jgi:farnesyl-diphosphate farnesyltransferase